MGKARASYPPTKADGKNKFADKRRKEKEVNAYCHRSRNGKCYFKPDIFWIVK